MDQFLSMKAFYVCQFGKHFSRLFVHIFVKSDGGYYLYALHHGLSAFLIAYSYLVNVWYIGIFILLIHDISDCFLIFMRFYGVRLLQFRNIEGVQKQLCTFLPLLAFLLGFFSEYFCVNLKKL